MKNLHSISQPVKQHLCKVYWTVATAFVAAALGVYVHTLLHIGGLLTSLGFIGATIMLMNTPAIASNESKRWNLLMAAAFLQGASAGTLIETVLYFDPSILVTAFLGSVAVFASFSGAALLAKRREFMFLGGLLSSAVSTMLTLQFFSMLFGGAHFRYLLEIYGGLILFSGYVIFDTQLIVEKAERGDMDYVKHSLDLFVDFAALFLRILVILTQKAADKEEKERRRRRNSSRY